MIMERGRDRQNGCWRRDERWPDLPMGRKAEKATLGPKEGEGCTACVCTCVWMPDGITDEEIGDRKGRSRRERKDRQTMRQTEEQRDRQTWTVNNQSNVWRKKKQKNRKILSEVKNEQKRIRRPAGTNDPWRRLIQKSWNQTFSEILKRSSQVMWFSWKHESILESDLRRFQEGRDKEEGNRNGRIIKKQWRKEGEKETRRTAQRSFWDR